MSRGWDTLSNVETPTPVAVDAISFTDYFRSRDADMGYFDIPFLNRDVLSQNFRNYHPPTEEWEIADNGMTDRFGANRSFWICHDCATFGWKEGQCREIFRCYNYRCHSRNVTVCKAGDISMLIRRAVVAPGVLMQDIYHARQERIRNRRALGEINDS